MAQFYAKREYHVVGFSRNAVPEEMKNYRHFQIDITDEKAVKNMMYQIKKIYQRLDILINNAAINPTDSLAMNTDFDMARKTMDVNFLGAFLMAKEAAKLMLKNRFGRIINIGSMAVRHEVSGASIYTASKAALTSFSRVFAKEIFPMGITCNVVAPSVIDTHLSRTVDPDAWAEVLKRNAVPAYGKLEDITNTIDWLIQPESGAITGQVVYLGGV